MADLDEISLTLGKLLQAQQDHAKKTEGLFRVTEEIKEGQAEVKGSVATLTAAHNALKKEIDDDIKPQVEDYKKNKQRGIGILAALGVGSGGVGAALASIIPKLSGSS